MRKPATLVDWALAPELLNPIDAANLSGYTVDGIDNLVALAYVDTVDSDAGPLIVKDSLRELIEVLHDINHAGHRQDDHAGRSA